MLGKVTAASSLFRHLTRDSMRKWVVLTGLEREAKPVAHSFMLCSVFWFQCGSFSSSCVKFVFNESLPASLLKKHALSRSRTYEGKPH